MIRLRHKRKRHPGASGVFLLLVGFSTSATLPLPPALAQPATAKPQFQLPVPKRDEFRRFVDLSRIENMCKSPLDLKVKDATLDDIIAQVKKVTSATTPIEVRAARPVRLTFDLQSSTVGATLGSVGSLAGCKVWVFADHLLLAPEDKLTAAEKADVEAQMGGEWAKNVEAGGGGWSARVKGQHQLLVTMANLFDQQRAKDPASKTTPTVALFGDLSPDGKAIMQQLVVWSNANARAADPQSGVVTLSPNTQITFTGAGADTRSTPGSVSMQVSNPADSNPHPPSTFWTFTP